MVAAEFPDLTDAQKTAITTTVDAGQKAAIVTQLAVMA
jgi:hypothetical protein